MDLDAFTSHYHLRNTRSGQLAYVDIGSGPVVLFVHGVCVNSALWRRVIAAVQHEYRCLAVDLPLHGRSPARADHNYSLATLAQALGDLLDDLDVPVVHLIGNDTGGAICQVFAATQRERLRSLTLTNCDTRDNIPPEPFVRTVELARQGRLAKTATRWVHNLNLVRSERISSPIGGRSHRQTRPFFPAGRRDRENTFTLVSVGVRVSYDNKTSTIAPWLCRHAIFLS